METISRDKHPEIRKQKFMQRLVDAIFGIYSKYTNILRGNQVRQIQETQEKF